MADDGNGNTLRWRVEQLESKQSTHEEGARWLSRAGERHNEQINTLRDDVNAMRTDVKEIPVLKAELGDLKDSWRAVRNAFFAAAGGLLVLAATIVYQAAA